MMENNSKVFQEIYENQELDNTIELLSYNQFAKTLNKNGRLIKIDFEQIKKCIWLVSILANSEDEDHCRKVQLFSMLTYLAFEENFSVERAAFLLLARIGNLTASKHFIHFKELSSSESRIKKEEVIDDYDAFLDLEISIQLQDKTLETADAKFLVTRFQKQLWQKLNTHSNISISAPTSAGKSFIIRNFVRFLIGNSINSHLIYIVPSRALINQVSEDFRNELKENVKIRTSFLDGIDNLQSKSYLYVLTPERCLKLLQFGYENTIYVDLIFIDEIQHIEDEQGRGTVLEFVLKELSTLFPKTQIITAGPNISNNSELFRAIFNSESLSAKTELSPVFQLKSIIKPIDNNKVEVTIKSLPNKSLKYQMDIGFDLSKILDENLGKALARVINHFAYNKSNLIYCPRSDYAETWALRSSEIDEMESEPKVDILNLIDFLEDEVHPSYYLIDCLKRQTAFHHSKLPDVVRKEIEDNFLNGNIKKLFCTSTLIEGVNLPANNLFILSPKILNDDLSPFRFGNLTGRAGRLKDSLYGTIYCIERSNRDEWADEFYDKSSSKEVLSSSDKAVKDFRSFQTQTSLSVREIQSKRDKNTVVLIRQKFMKDESELRRYLEGKNLPNDSITKITDDTRNILFDVVLPYEITRKNPGIDPVLQNELFNKIIEAGVEQWCIHKNKNFDSRVKAENVVRNFEERSFFWQMVDIIERLDTIFQIWREVNIDYSIDLSLRQMTAYAVRWTTGESYRKLIREDINFMSKHNNPEKRIDINNRNHINRRINVVIKINSVVVSYVFVKYFKLLNDILESLLTEEQREQYRFSLSLPTMLELGTRSSEVHTLISYGLPRSIAMKVFEMFKKTLGHENLNIVEWLKNQEDLNLKPIYRKYLRNLKLISI